MYILRVVYILCIVYYAQNGLKVHKYFNSTLHRAMNLLNCPEVNDLTFSYSNAVLELALSPNLKSPGIDFDKPNIIELQVPFCIR